MDILSKIITAEKLVTELDEARSSGEKVVFYRTDALIFRMPAMSGIWLRPELKEIFVVGLNSDASVRLIKGDKRPILHQNHRAEVLASLGCVDYVVLFDAPVSTDPDSDTQTGCAR